MLPRSINISRIVYLALPILTVSTLLTACGKNQIPDVEESHPQPELVHRNVWSTDGTVDLFSRESELVRATMESAELTFRVGIRGAFSGYEGAVEGPQELPNGNFDERSRWLIPDPVDFQPTTIFRHIVDVESSPNLIAANVCGYQLRTEGDNPNFSPLREAMRIELHLPQSGSRGQAGIIDTDQEASDPRAKHPPDWNIFGDWKIDRISVIPVSNEFTIPESCMSWWGQQFPEFVHRSRYNILHAPEGWTAPTIPLATQYPEWIGPSKPE